MFMSFSYGPIASHSIERAKFLKKLFFKRKSKLDPIYKKL
jgi:hypothetical protein